MNAEEHEETNDSIEAGAPDEFTKRDAPRQITEWGRSVTTYIGENPELCLALALALGAAIGLVVKRR